MSLLLILILRGASSDINIKWISDVQSAQSNASDIALFFIAANSVQHEKPNQDPIFEATTELPIEGSDVKRYRPNNAVAILGCVDQHQICEPSTEQCTDLLGVKSVLKAAEKLPLNLHQHATAEYIWNAIFYNNIFFIVDPRGAAALQASESVFQNLQQSVSDTQWITEVNGWFGTSLAKLQQAMIDIARGPLKRYPGVRYTKPGTNPQNDLLSNLCNQQIVRSNGHFLNFSVVGVTLIFAICSSIILLSFVIDWIAKLVRGCFSGRKDTRIQHWNEDDILALYTKRAEGP